MKENPPSPIFTAVQRVICLFVTAIPSCHAVQIFMPVSSSEQAPFHTGAAAEADMIQTKESMVILNQINCSPHCTSVAVSIALVVPKSRLKLRGGGHSG